MEFQVGNLDFPGILVGWFCISLDPVPDAETQLWNSGKILLLADLDRDVAGLSFGTLS